MTHDGGSGDWTERQPPRRSGRHSRTPRDYGVPDPYAAADPYARPAPGAYPPADPYAAPGRHQQPDPSAGSYSAPGPYDPAGPYPPAAPGAPAGPYRGQDSPGPPAGRNGQTGPYAQPGPGAQPGPYAQPGPGAQPDPYGQPGRNGTAGPYGRGHASPEPGPYARTDPNAALGPYARPAADPLAGGGSPGRRDPLPGRGVPPGRDPLSGQGSAAGRDSFPGRDPLGPADLRYGQPSPGPRDPYPQRDGFPPRVPRDAAAPDAGRTDAYGRPGSHPPAERNGQGQGRQPRHGGPAGYGGQNGHVPSGGGRAADFSPRDANGRRGFRGERDAHDPAALSGADDHGPFRWQPSPGASRPEAPGAAAGHRGAMAHEPTPPGSGDWDPGQASGRPARRRPPDAGGPGGTESGPGTAGPGEWSYDEGEPAQWDDEQGHDGLIPGFGERRETRRGRGSRPRRRVGRAVAPVLAPLIALVVLAGLAAGGYKIYQKFQSPDYTGAGYGLVTVQVLPGDTAESLAPRLVNLGVVASTSSFVSAVKQSSDPTGLQPGFFRLHKHMKAALAYKLLLNPASRIQSAVTIPEGLRLTQILSLLAAKSGISASSYAKAVKDTAALGLPAYAKGNPEGYLFPATYDVNPGASATSVLQSMVTRFNQEASSINLPAAAAADHLTPGQVIIVASLLEAEGGNPKYYTRVAEVIYNRLRMHMNLGLQSTVEYVLHKNTASLTAAQLHVNSPYNTYIHPGLPPGPIDSPGDLAIQAALHPAHGDLLYFVTVNLRTGLTEFTNSPSVFNELVALCRRNNSC